MNSDFFFFLLVRKPFSCSEYKGLTDHTIQTCGSQRVQSSALCLPTWSITDSALTLKGGRFGSQKDFSSLLLFWLPDLFFSTIVDYLTCNSPGPFPISWIWWSSLEFEIFFHSFGHSALILVQKWLYFCIAGRKLLGKHFEPSKIREEIEE